MSTLLSEAALNAATPPDAALSCATVQARLDELQVEHGNGLQQLARLDRQRTELGATLERIEGAITVLRELLGPPRPTASPGPG